LRPNKFLSSLIQLQNSVKKWNPKYRVYKLTHKSVISHNFIIKLITKNSIFLVVDIITYPTELLDIYIPQTKEVFIYELQNLITTNA